MFKVKLYSKKLTASNQVERCFVAGYIDVESIECICDTVIGDGQPHIKCTAIIFNSGKTIYAEGDADTLISAISKSTAPNPDIEFPVYEVVSEFK